MRTCGSEAIYEVEGVAGDTCDVNDLRPNGLLNGAIDALESVETRVFVRQSSTNPRLGVAHLPPERNGSEVPELRHSAGELVGGVRELLDAVLQGGSLPLVGRSEADEAGGEGGGVGCAVHAGGDGG